MDTGNGADFYVQPMAVSVYADVVRECSGRVSRIVGALGSCPVDAAWFGRMPQAGHLADAYGRHRESCLTRVGEAAAFLAAIADGLDANAAAYVGADAVAAEEFGAIAGRGDGVGGGVRVGSGGSSGSSGRGGPGGHGEHGGQGEHGEHGEQGARRPGGVR